MRKLIKKDSDVIPAFISVYILLILINIVSQLIFDTVILPTMLFSAAVIVWGTTIYQRILHKKIMRYIIAADIFLLLLFIIRLCRYYFYQDLILIDRYLWYSYYIPFIVLPTLMFCTACYVEKNEEQKLPFTAKALWVLTGILLCTIITNDLHHFAFFFADIHDYSGSVSYHWLYYTIVIWSFLLTISAFVILIRQCRLSQSRRSWYIPVVISALGVILLAVYFVCGGSPMVSDIKLYNLQEMYAFLFIGIWESCIQIGLIKSNTGYLELFEFSSVNAALVDADEKIVFRSADFTPQKDSEEHITRRKPIKDGFVVWSEDLSAIHRINIEIKEATERIEEENDLIEEENRLTSDLVRYETQNKLYDRISAHTRHQLVKIDDALADEDMLDQRVKFCLLLGTYIKRCANMMLIADKQDMLSTDELYLSIHESFEYMSFLGIECELKCDKQTLLPSQQIIAAYDLFEAVIESGLVGMSAGLVHITPDERTVMIMETDQDSVDMDRDLLHKTLQAAGLTLSSEIADDMHRFTLYTGGAANE